MSEPRNPYPTVDVIIEIADGVVFIERANTPRGWALPGAAPQRRTAPDVGGIGQQPRIGK